MRTNKSKTTNEQLPDCFQMSEYLKKWKQAVIYVIYEYGGLVELVIQNCLVLTDNSLGSATDL